MTIIDEIRARARMQPDHPAVIVDGTGGAPADCVTYSELVERMDAFAEKLRHAGCRPFERTGLLAAQGIGFIEAGLGILAAGMCFVPLTDEHDGQALEDFIKRSSLQHLVKESANFEIQHFPDAGDVDGQNDEVFRTLQPAYIRFTSGTTNERKGVVIGHQSILDRLANANAALNIGPEDRIMWMLPMAHHFVVSILLYLRYGATILMPTGFLSPVILKFANSHSATVFYASPYHYDLLAKDTSTLKLPNVRLAISTASGLSEDIAQRFAERMDIPLTQALGVIEVGLPVINLLRAREKSLSLGQVLPAYDVWLRGDDGQAVSDSHTENSGEVCIRGTGTFDAYMSPWILASEIMEPDGFCTGDQGYFDDDGDLVIQGRRHNRINMAGMKFFVEEVEAVMNLHPAIKESRVFGQAHHRLGEIPMAQVVLEDSNNSPDKQELALYCKQRLAAHKVPFSFEIVPELAYTVTGKIKRW